MAKVEKNVLKKTTYNPSKNYVWKPEDEFVLDGRELQQLYNTLLAKTQDPQWVQIANEYESFKILQSVFERGVEQGVIIEQQEDHQEVIAE